MSDQNLVYLDPESQFSLRSLEESHWGAVAEVLRPAVLSNSQADVLDRMVSWHVERALTVVGGFLNGQLVGAYVLKRDGMANQVALIAVLADFRLRGIGRAMLTDALRRSGKRPLVAETDDDAMGFYKACGFKLVGRRKHPDGAIRYRLGWHAPGMQFKGGTSSALTTSPIEDKP